MEHAATTDVPATEVAQIQAQMPAYIAEMQRANDRSLKDLEEIDRLKAKTRATLAELAGLKVI